MRQPDSLVRLGYRTLILTLVAFGATYMAMVFADRAGVVPYAILGAVLFGLVVFSWAMCERTRANPARSNMWGILCGLWFWAFVGEVMENLGWADIASWHYAPVLVLLAAGFIFVAARRSVPARFLFAGGHFLGIWGLHMIMIAQLEHLGPTHWSTYPAAAVFAGGVLLAVLRLRRVRSTGAAMAWGRALLLLAWTVLEYAWAWRLIPGPYSVS